MDKENTQPRQTVLFENVGSIEYYEKDGQKKQILQGISFEAKTGEAWCITGELAFEMRLLLEIAANARPYESGRCVLDQRGMMRKKRVILPHVFYIGGTNMMFDNMNVLEYLMFITQKSEEHPVKRQRAIFDRLRGMGLGYLSLTPTQNLTPAERSVIMLLAASYTKSVLFVWNLPRLTYSDVLVAAAAQICADLRAQGRTLLFSTRDYELADKIATHMVLLKRGTVAYAGPAEPFRTQWDRLVLTVTAPDAQRYQEVFEKTAPAFFYQADGDMLRVYDRGFKAKDLALFYGMIALNNLAPERVERNRPNIGNAVEAALASDDI